MKNLKNEIKINDLDMQDPYPTGGSFPVEGGASYNGNWYESHAVDADGNEYMVRWTDVDWSADDDACDWDSPNYIFEI